MSGPLWTLVTIVGPILLLLALAWALMRNKRHEAPGEIARTERATHDLYQETDAREKRQDDLNG